MIADGDGFEGCQVRMALAASVSRSTSVGSLVGSVASGLAGSVDDAPVIALLGRFCPFGSSGSI